MVKRHQTCHAPAICHGYCAGCQPRQRQAPNGLEIIPDQGRTFQVMVHDLVMMIQLAMRNDKLVILSGTFANAGEKGVFPMAEALIESDLPSPERRKRGGL